MNVNVNPSRKMTGEVVYYSYSNFPSRAAMLKQIFNDEAANTRPDRLSPAELDAAFAKIRADYLEGKPASGAPHLLYVTGLPGAGKSTFIAHAKQQAAGLADYVTVNFDDLRVYHPRYAAHVKQDPVNAAARIDIATGELIGRLLEEAAALKVNVLLDDAAMGGDVTGDILTPFKTAGYIIDAAVIAVPAVMAQQSVAARFADDLAAARSGAPVMPRWVNTAEQEKAPDALQGTVEVLAGSGLLRHLTIITREGEKLTGDPVIVVAQETQRALTPAEQARYDKSASRIDQALKNHLPPAKQRGGVSPS